MSTTSITIRMDDSLKKQAEALFDDMGMNMTTAFTIFAKAAVRQGKIPFEVVGDPFYNEFNQARLRRAAADLSCGKGSEHSLIEDDADA